MSLKRRKRASPEQLYKHCIGGGDCIPDVQNKFEQNTWADVLLKIFGSLVYFGNLGIGTGKGSGGSLGYRPLDSVGPGRPTTITPARPNITIDAVGPSDLIPIDAGGSSIVPLAEGTIDTSFVSPDAGPGLGAEDIELYTITSPTTDIGGTSTTPTIVSSEEGAVAVIDAQPIPERPVQVYFDPSASAVNEVTVFPALQSNITDVNIFADPTYSGTIIGGYDEIPLNRLDVAEFEIDETPLTSTPTQKLESAINKAKSYYNRFIKQVPVRDPDFLNQPTRLAQFEFVNPAFEPEVTIEFERDLADVAAAPNEEFRDIITLRRPTLSAVEGTVRVSRIGETGTIATRSGTVIGQKVHFYYDISTISAPETIELAVIQDTAGQSTIVDDLLASRTVDTALDSNIAVSEEDLLDPYEETFHDGHLVVITSEQQETELLPAFGSSSGITPAVIDFSDITVHQNSLTPAVNYTDFSELVPGKSHSVIFTSFEDYFLNPALYPPKKRRRLDYF